jgi:Hint domain
MNASSATIASGDTVTLAGGVLDPVSTIVVNGSAIIGGSGTIEGAVGLNTATAEIMSSGGSLEVTGAVSGSGTLDLASGSTLQLDGAVGSASAVVFAAGTAETLVLGSPGAGDIGNFAATITSFQAGDAIVLAGTSIASVGFAGNVATLLGSDGGEIGTLAFASGAVCGGYLTASGGALTQIACFAAGTRIATAQGEGDGEVAVEDLREGDLVRTVLGGGAAAIS